MTSRKLIITLSVFVLLLIYVLLTQTGNKGFNTLNLPQLPQMKADEIQELIIRQPVETLRLQKNEKGWQMVAPLSFPVEKMKLDNLLQNLSDLRITNLVTEQSQLAADYGLTSSTAVGMIIKSQQHKLELELGKTNQEGTHTFARLPGEGRIYQVLGDWQRQLSLPAKDWRSLTIYDFSPDQIQEVTITQKGKPLLHFAKSEEVEAQIVKDSPQNVTSTPLPVKIVWKAKGRNEPLNDPKVNQFLTTICRLRAAKILDLATWSGVPLGTVKMKTTAGDQTLEILEFNKPEQQYLVRRAGENLIYQIYEYQGKSLLKVLEDFVK